MRNLLGEKDRRRLAISETIALNPGISTEEIAEEFNISTMQVQVDVAFLNEIIHPLIINLSKEKSYILYVPEHLSTKYIYQQVLAHNINFQLLELLLTQEFDNYDRLADALFISTATLKRTIQYVNQCFEGHQISIKSRPIRIEGNESNIRAFYHFYFQERYPNDIETLPITERAFAKELTELYVSRFSKSEFPYARRIRLERYVAIALLRETRRKQERVEINISQEMLTIALEDINRYKNKVLLEQVLKIELTPDVYIRLLSHYINDHRASSIEDLHDRVLVNSDNACLYNQIKSSVNVLSQTLNIPVINEEKLYFKLYNMMTTGLKLSITPYAIYPARKIFLLFNKTIRTSMLELAKQAYREEIPLLIHKNEAYFYEYLYILVTHWDGFYKRLIQDSNPCRIGLFFNSDYEHMVYMKDDLEFQFGDKVRVAILNIMTLNELPKHIKDMDVLIVNFMLPDTLDIQVPIISVSDTIWGDKIQQIQKHINRIYYKNMQKE